MMKRIALLLSVSLLIGCADNKQAGKTVPEDEAVYEDSLIDCLDSVPQKGAVEEVIIEYPDSSCEYKHHGLYKKVFRKYAYIYHDSTLCTVYYNRNQKTGKGLWIEAWVNEYGDTVCIKYTRLDNYPRREDPKYAD